MKELIYIIKTGTKQEAKEAIKKIDAWWDGIGREKREAEKKKLEVFIDEMQNLDEVANEENKIYFIDSLRTPVWVLGDKYFKDFCDFILKYIEHPYGNMRRAILRLASWFSMIGLDCIDGRAHFGKKPDKDEMELMKTNKELYFNLVKDVDNLMEKHREPKFEKYKYIDDLPASVYKSLEYLVSNELLRVPKYEILYAEFLNKQKGYEAPLEILQRRKEIEKELTKLLEEVGGNFDLDDIKEIIFNEEESGDMQDIIRIFDDGDLSNLENVLELTTDAWNYFPHKILNGLSPAEQIWAYKNRN